MNTKDDSNGGIAPQRRITRKGKVARMPYVIREEVNRRLQDGQSNTEIAKWLNEHPAVKARLAEIFWSGRFSDQNVSEWRKGGYSEWLAKNARFLSRV